MVVSLMAVGLKYHYSHASSDDLAWILGPTAGVVEYLSGIVFEKEGGAGFVNRANRIVIAPSCAGVNFLIIAFCMAAFSGLCHLKSSLLKIFWMGSSAAWAYVLTIAVNAFRIVASIYLYNADIYYHGLTPERLHRIEGIVIYFFFLCLFYVTLDKIMGFCIQNRIPGHKKRIPKHSDSKKSRHALFIPLFWYLLICLGIPILNRGYLENVPQFAEHCRVVLSVCMVVFLVVFLIQSGCGWIFRKIQVYRLKREPS
jgi:exosortase K